MSACCLILSFVFSFQAEDGIRDIGVTGVQTCALPIWSMGTDTGANLLSPGDDPHDNRSEEHTSELQSRQYLVCRLLLEKKQTEEKSQPVDGRLVTQVCVPRARACS